MFLSENNSSGSSGREPPVLVKYSAAFKMQVVKEVESGKLSIAGVQRKYGITGNGTIQGWLRRFGKCHTISKVVRVEHPQERDRVKQLEAEKRQLESALAQTQMKLMAYEKLVEIAEREYRIDIKKNCGTMPLEHS